MVSKVTVMIATIVPNYCIRVALPCQQAVQLSSVEKYGYLSRSNRFAKDYAYQSYRSPITDLLQGSTLIRYSSGYGHRHGCYRLFYYRELYPY